MKLLLIPIAMYLGIVTLMFVTQRSLLYLPAARVASAAELDTLGLSRWPDDGPYRGYLADRPSARATLVVFPGNAGAAIDRYHYVEALDFLNARLLLVEYPGYGGRDGRPSEAVLVADGRETLRRLRSQFPDEPLFVMGESLGAAVAAGAAGSDESGVAGPPVDGLLLLTPWDSLSTVAGHHYPFLPVSWLLLDRYPSARRLADVTVAKIVVVAEHDEVVPARYGRALFDALPERREFVIVDGARHNDWPGRVDRRWWQARWDQLEDHSSSS